MLMSGPTAAPEGELLEGIYIMRADSLEEAQELAGNDPAVLAGALMPIVCTFSPNTPLKIGSPAFLSNDCHPILVHPTYNPSPY
jgi:hypothetical protein